MRNTNDLSKTNDSSPTSTTETSTPAGGRYLNLDGGKDREDKSMTEDAPMKVNKIASEKDILSKFKTSEVTITTLETETEKQFSRNSPLRKFKSARGRFSGLKTVQRILPHPVSCLNFRIGRPRLL